MVATTPPAASNVERRTDVLCPVQIHVQDPSIGEQRRQATKRDDTETRQKWGEDYPRKWIDLDENILDGYILIDDGCLGPTMALDESQELPYPEGAAEIDDDDDDADSHGKDDSSIYNRRRQGISRRPGENLDLCTTYPLANSHGSGREWSSHPKYSELYSHVAVKKFLEANREDPANYSVANSHGNRSVSSMNREGSFRDTAEADQLNWGSRPSTNYEVANSHTSYGVYLEGHAQQEDTSQTSGWPATSWREHMFNTSVPEEQKLKSANVSITDDDDTVRTSRTETKLECEHTVEPACDIEQCLVEIEESLLNIEQNLLHVQDLDIPELRNLLYNSPSIEKSLFEVQDLLYTDGIVTVIKKKTSLSLESEEENEDDEEDEEEEQVWVGRNLTIKDNDDEVGNAGASLIDPSNELSDTANVQVTNQSSGSIDHCSNGSTILQEEDSLNYTEKAINFIPNSLNKTLPRRIVLDGAKENIRLCSSEPEEPTTTIDYNLNTTCAEKKLLCRDKCHNRTNSLDENSTFPNLDSSDKLETGKCSLQNLLIEPANGNSLDHSGKARSEEILQTSREKFLRNLNRRSVDDKRWTITEAKAEDVQRKIEPVASHRRFTVSGANDSKRIRVSKEWMERGTSSKDKSPSKPRRGTLSSDKSQESTSGKSFEKRKRKKISSRSHNSSENALVPSKLISLSLSLLLAALLQAVRCLTDLVEDAFKSVSYDRSGLLQ